MPDPVSPTSASLAAAHTLPPSAEQLRRQTNRRAILAILAAMAAFVTNDAMVKYTSQSLPAAQLIFMRGATACLIVLCAAYAMGELGRIREMAHRWVVIRTASETTGTMLYLTSLFHLPIGNATAINMAAPLFITIFAAWFMREKVNGLRWLAIGVGFTGVLLVIQPRANGFNSFAILCLVATVFHAARDLLTRRIPSTVPGILITLASALGVTLVSGVLSLVQGWAPFTWQQMATLGLASLFLVIGNFLIIYGMRHGEVSLVAPFRYSSLLFAVLLGFGVWGDVPNALAWIGIALLVGSGLTMLRSERR